MARNEGERVAAMIARRLHDEAERERREESEMRAERLDALARDAGERAFAYECALSFVLGVLDVLVAEG